MTYTNCNTLSNKNTSGPLEIKVDMKARWRIDYYSQNKEIIKQLVLNHVTYSYAKLKAIAKGRTIDYSVFDIYSIF